MSRLEFDGMMISFSHIARLQASKFRLAVRRSGCGGTAKNQPSQAGARPIRIRIGKNNQMPRRGRKKTRESMPPAYFTASKQALLNKRERCRATTDFRIGGMDELGAGMMPSGPVLPG
jgi:hypothetical protein